MTVYKRHECKVSHILDRDLVEVSGQIHAICFTPLIPTKFDYVLMENTNFLDW
jgi:hypothetical protein